MTAITTKDGTEIYYKNATLVGHSTGGGAVYIGRHGTKRVVFVAAVPPIMLKSAANPEGLPMEHFDKLRSGITVRDGEWLGEMGVIKSRSRIATARAASDGEGEVLTARQFLERVSSEPAPARDLILRLSIRLRRIEDKIAGDLLPFARDRSPEGAGQSAPDAAIAEDARISIAAQSGALRARIGAAPIHVAKLPFLAGRIPVAGEAKPLRRVDLLIEDDVPFRLSRQHFMIARSGDQLLVADLGSALGTIVNGQAIGHHFMKDGAPLHRGENHIVAGGWGSPFEFLVSIGQ